MIQIRSFSAQAARLGALLFIGLPLALGGCSHFLNSSASPGTMLVATIDTSGSIEVARSTAAGRWSTNLAWAGAHRQSLSGSGCVQSPRPLIFWTEPTATGSSSFKIRGADLTSVL